MEDITTAREKILKKVRAGLLNKFSRHFPDVDQESGLFRFADEDHVVAFGKKFTEKGSGLVYCHNFFDFVENIISFIEKRHIKELTCSDADLRKELKDTGLPVEEPGSGPVKYALVNAEALISRNGSILLSSRSSSRTLMSSAETLLIYGRVSHLADDMKHGILLLKNRYGDKLPGVFTFYQGATLLMDKNGKKTGLPETIQEIILFMVNDR